MTEVLIKENSIEVKFLVRRKDWTIILTCNVKFSKHWTKEGNCIPIVLVRWQLNYVRWKWIKFASAHLKLLYVVSYKNNTMNICILNLFLDNAPILYPQKPLFF